VAMTLTHEQAVLVGRIRDALGALGYEVPAGVGPGTLSDLAKMAPAIARFAAAMGAEFSRSVSRKQDPMARAKMVADLAEKVAKAGSATHRAVGLAEVLATGFMAYRAAKKKGNPAAVVAGIVNTITAATSR
jgi:hypothetical protein